MNRYRHLYSKSRFLLSVPYFNVFHLFSKSMWYEISHLTGMLLFCREFTFEMFKIMKLALTVVSVLLNQSWY